MTEPRWLTPEENAVWMAVLPVLELVPAAIDAQLRRDHGITRFEYNVLAMLSASEGDTRPMTDLSVMTNGSLSRLSHAVMKLERKGWLKRSPSTEDRRITVVSLADEGRTVLTRAAPSHVAEVRRLLFDAIPAESLPILTAIMRPIAALNMPDGGKCLDDLQPPAPTTRVTNREQAV